MGRYYSDMAFQRKARTIRLQQDSTTEGRFMNASIIHFQMIVVVQIRISLPLPLMIVTDHIKEPATPLILL